MPRLYSIASSPDMVGALLGWYTSSDTLFDGIEVNVIRRRERYMEYINQTQRDNAPLYGAAAIILCFLCVTTTVRTP